MQSGGARQVGRIRMRCRGSMAMPLAAQLLMSILYAVPVAPSIGGQDGLLVQRIWAMDPRHSRERSTEKLHGDSAGFRQLLRLRGGESKSSQAQVPTLVILRHGCVDPPSPQTSSSLAMFFSGQPSRFSGQPSRCDHLHRSILSPARYAPEPADSISAVKACGTRRIGSRDGWMCLWRSRGSTMHTVLQTC